MEVKILREAGIDEALLGMSLSYESNIDKMYPRAVLLSSQDHGHNKFLESIVLWLDIIAPRFWWSQADTYRAGVTKQSSSTMHTLSKKEFSQKDFEHPIPQNILNILNTIPKERLKNILPEGFLQRRIVCLNYKVLRTIIKQRLTHKLPEWQTFITAILTQCQNPEFLKDLITC